MSKRTISYICHSLFWNLLLFFPVIYICFFTLSGLQFQSSLDGLGNNIPVFMYNLTLYTPYGQVINSFLTSNTFGIYTLVDGASCFYSVLLTWFITVELFHLFFDFIFFLPKLFYRFIKCRFDI